MNKTTAISWTLKNFTGRNEWGCEFLLFFLRKLNRMHDDETISRAEIFAELDEHQDVITIDILTLPLCEMQDFAEANNIRTVKLDGTEVL